MSDDWNPYTKQPYAPMRASAGTETPTCPECVDKGMKVPLGMCGHTLTFAPAAGPEGTPPLEDEQTTPVELRLRVWADNEYRKGPGVGNPYLGWLLREGAKEIEQLRAELARLKAETPTHCCTHSDGTTPVCGRFYLGPNMTSCATCGHHEQCHAPVPSEALVARLAELQWENERLTKDRDFWRGAVDHERTTVLRLEKRLRQSAPVQRGETPAGALDTDDLDYLPVRRKDEKR